MGLARKNRDGARILAALENGHNINAATTTLDASGARTFALLRAAVYGSRQMTGSPNHHCPDQQPSGPALGAECRLGSL
jgi:hypothetical protein